jgi:hypothetical protein
MTMLYNFIRCDYQYAIFSAKLSISHTRIAHNSRTNLKIHLKKQLWGKVCV